MSQYGKPRTFRNAEWVVMYTPVTDGPAFRDLSPRSRITEVFLINAIHTGRLSDACPTRLRDIKGGGVNAADIPPFLRAQAARYIGKPYSSWLAASA